MVLVSLRSWAAWFSSRRAMVERRLSSRPSSRPVFSHFPRRASPSLARERALMPSVSVSIIDIIKNLLNIYFYLLLIPASVAQRFFTGLSSVVSSLRRPLRITDDFLDTASDNDFGPRRVWVDANVF